MTELPDGLPGATDTGASRRTVRAAGAPRRLPPAGEPEQVLSQALRAMAGEPGGPDGRTISTQGAVGPEFVRWLLRAVVAGVAVGVLIGLVSLVL